MMFQWQEGDLLIKNRKIIGFLINVLENDNLIQFYRAQSKLKPNFVSESSSSSSRDKTGDNFRN